MGAHLPTATCLFQTNTFQAVLLMDDQDTYVMYNYERINWSYGAASLSTPAQVSKKRGTHAT